MQILCSLTRLSFSLFLSLCVSVCVFVIETNQYRCITCIFFICKFVRCTHESNSHRWLLWMLFLFFFFIYCVMCVGTSVLSLSVCVYVYMCLCVWCVCVCWGIDCVQLWTIALSRLILMLTSLLNGSTRSWSRSGHSLCELMMLCSIVGGRHIELAGIGICAGRCCCC